MESRRGALLSGASAFREIELALAGRATTAEAAEPAFHRALAAIRSAHLESFDRPSPIDLAILLRHVVRYWSGATGLDQSLGIPALGPPISLADWQMVGVAVEDLGETKRIRALPWTPSWLSDVPHSGVDGLAAAEPERRHYESVAGDPLLRGLGLDAYRSMAQRVAVRSALLAPPGSTLAICLATGEGKSLVFQAIDAARGHSGAGIGVTVVIMPTVALALDQERAARELGLPDIPRAYCGDGDTGQNEQIARAIAEGEQGLCFVSPEAACGSLRRPLLSAAQRGILRALVIDEAHLVEAWGEEFRPDYQLLSGLRNTLLTNTAHPFRTLLLSATFTSSSLHVLGALFNRDLQGNLATLPLVAAPTLRPEIDYWAAGLAEDAERRARVEDALMHLPRPAILYVSRREDAKTWYKRLHDDDGFRRLAVVTGETPMADRDRIVDQWRRGQIDLVIGTSAFGLGIDNPHVRSVIHACIPETLDRFYQEVGRGGRDGRASVSVLVPSKRDFGIARNLNEPCLISVDVGLERWKAMFRHHDRQTVAAGRFVIRLDVAPGTSAGRIDMDNDLNTGWNIKTLTLMSTAGLIALETPVGREPSAAEASGYRSSIGVRILEPGHLDRDVWVRLVEGQRRKVLQASKHSLRLLGQYVGRGACLGSLLADQYTFLASESGTESDVTVEPKCSGCPECRGSGGGGAVFRPRTPAYPWPAQQPVDELLVSLIDETGRLMVCFDPPLIGTSPRARRRTVDCLVGLINRTGHNLVAAPSPTLNLLRQALIGSQVFVADPVHSASLPPGPSVWLLDGVDRIHESAFAKRDLRNARVFIVPRSFVHPADPACLLLDRYDGNWIRFDDLQSLLAQ
jgi:ATP-dependent DNA helicase RecQ